MSFHWQERAACAGLDTELFFQEHRTDPRAHGNAAKAICAKCSVKRECLDYALETDQRWGVWGGTTEQERSRMPRGKKSA